MQEDNNTEQPNGEQPVNESEGFKSELESTQPQTYAPTPITPLQSETSPNPDVAGPAATRSFVKKLLKLLLVLLIIAALGVAGWYFWDQSQPVAVQNNAPQIQEIESLRIGTTEGPLGGIFPSTLGSGVSINQSRQIYEGLVGGEDKKYVPLLAESWTNPDQKTWIFKLKPNVKFHTGKTMTAKDVKASLDAIKELEFWSVTTDTIETVDVISDSEVRITTAEPDSLLLNRLSFAYIFDSEAPEKSGNNGTGPYQLDASKEQTESYSALAAFSEYHQGQPKAKNVEYKIYSSEDEVVEAMKNNEIDYTELVSTKGVDQELVDLGFKAESYEAPGVFGVYMNIERTEDTPLKNESVREAIALAIDRESLITEIESDSVPATQVVPKSLPGHDPELSFPEYNLESAQQTLLQAYPDGVTLEYVYFEGVQPDAPVLIAQLREAGFTIVERPETDPNVLTNKLLNGEYDLFSASYISDIYDSRDILGSVISSTANYAGYTNDATYEKFLEDSDKEFDPTKRIAILQEANRYIAENFLWIPVRKTVYTAYYKSDLEIKVDYSEGSNLGVYYWKVGRRVE